MDESWRMRMGVNNGPTHRRRQSMTARVSDSDTSLEPEDFEDVFGGPPRSVLARKHSADFTNSDWFYNEIFRQQDQSETPVITAGRRLPEFVIPDQRRSRQTVKSVSKMKSVSSSNPSFEDQLCEFVPSSMVTRDEDVVLSSFTSRLRPINVANKWNSTDLPSFALKPKLNKHDLPAFGCTMDKNQFTTEECDDYMITSCKVGQPRLVTSHGTINLEPGCSKMQAMGDCGMPLMCQGAEVEKMSKFIYEGNMKYQLHSHTAEANSSEAIDVNEAIAWAKDKFRGWSSNNMEQQESNKFLELHHNY